MYMELLQAFRGKLLWNQIEKKYCADKYLIMPHNGDEYNTYALQYIDVYLQKECAGYAVIFTNDRDVIEKCEAYKGKYKLTSVLMSKSRMDSLLRFYALYEFSKKITIISLTNPYDTCGENLLGVNGITKRELLCYDIYHFSEIPETDSGSWE